MLGPEYWHQHGLLFTGCRDLQALVNMYMLQCTWDTMMLVLVVPLWPARSFCVS
jgi:hypothetical protein